MLRFRVAVPDEGPGRDGSPVAVLLHGRGSDEQDLLGLAPRLPAWLTVVTVRAPFAGHEWGYGPGWAWYRYLAEDRVVPETLERSLKELDDFMERIEDALGFEPGPVGLGGFSQGGTVSLAYALRNPGLPAFVLVFSGFLADAEGVEVTRESVAGTPIFWGHGTRDPAIPHALARKGRDRLLRVGADLTARDYELGHGVDPEELRDVSAWLAEVLG